MGYSQICTIYKIWWYIYRVCSGHAKCGYDGHEIYNYAEVLTFTIDGPEIMDLNNTHVVLKGVNLV